MRNKGVAGKTVARIHQQRIRNNGTWYYHLQAIEFTDGSFLRFCVAEDDQGGEYIVEGVYPGRNPNP